MKEMVLLEKSKYDQLLSIEEKYYALKKSSSKEADPEKKNEDESPNSATEFEGNGLLPLLRQKPRPSSSVPKLPKLIDKPIVPIVSPCVYVHSKRDVEAAFVQTMPQRYIAKSKKFMKQINESSNIRINSDGDVFINETKLPGDGFALMKSYLTDGKKYVVGKEQFFQAVNEAGLGHFQGKRPEALKDFSDKDEWWYIGEQ